MDSDCNLNIWSNKWLSDNDRRPETKKPSPIKSTIDHYRPSSLYITLLWFYESSHQQSNIFHQYTTNQLLLRYGNMEIWK